MKRSKKSSLSLISKQRIPIIVIAAATVVTLIGFILAVLLQPSQAGSGDIYLKEKTKSADANQDIIYEVRVRPDTPIDTVTATLSYDTSALTYKSAVYTDSPFTTQIPAIAQDGLVTLQAAQFNGKVRDDSLFARVTFTASRADKHTVKLSAGNAALAGVATYPSLNGTTQDVKKLRQADCQGSSCTTDTTNNSGSGVVPTDNPVLGASQSLLQSSGLSAPAAQRSAPWFIGLIVCLIVAIPVIIVSTQTRSSRKTKTIASRRKV